MKFSDAAVLVARAWSDGLRPDPLVLPSDWAERHRILLRKTSKTPGRFRLSLIPYMTEILDCFALDSGVDEVSVQKGRQSAFTEGLALSLIGYWIDQAPAPIMYVLPSIDLARAISKERIQPMLLETAVLRSKVIEPKTRDAENTVLYKEFLGGFLVIGGANSALSFRERSVRYLVLDEVDAYPPDVGGEGDPIDLARGRQDAMEGVSKTLIFSTPKIRDHSAIEREVSAGDRRVYLVPCPFCGGFQTIEWSRIQWHGNPEIAALECLHCNREIEEKHRHAMLLAGHWEPTQVSQNPRARSYHINGLYSLMRSWASRARHWERSHAINEKLKVFINTVLAETWTDPDTTVEVSSLTDRLEPFPERLDPQTSKPVLLVPRKVLALTCGVDVQKGWWAIHVLGWGVGEELWAIEHVDLDGDTDKPAQWESVLYPYLAERTWEHELGHDLRLQAVCIDSGFKPHRVYEFVKGRRARRWYATKGKDQAGRPFVGAPSKRRSGKGRRPVDVQIIGTDDARADVLSRLRTKEDLPGYVHLPVGRGYTKQVLDELLAMTPQPKYHHGVPGRVWVLKPGARKEALDCWIGAIAAMLLWHPPWRTLERDRLRRELELSEGPPAGDDEPPEPQAPPLRRRVPAQRRRGNWATGWKHF